MRKSFIAMVLVFCAASLRAQIPNLDFGIGAGMASYQGDIPADKLGSYRTPGFGFHGFINYTFSPWFALRGSLATTKIKGRDSVYNLTYHKSRNFSFTTVASELSGQLVFMPIRFPENGLTGKFLPYLLGGVGVDLLNVKRNFTAASNRAFLPPSIVQGIVADSSKPLPKVIPVLQVGGGARFYLAPDLSIFVEALHRFTNTDYLDGFSQSANPNTKDMYTTVVIGFTMSLQ